MKQNLWIKKTTLVQQMKHLTKYILRKTLLVVTLLNASKIAYSQDYPISLVYDYIYLDDSTKMYNFFNIQNFYNDSTFSFSFTNLPPDITKIRYASDSFCIKNNILKIYNGNLWVDFFRYTNNQIHDILFISIIKPGFPNDSSMVRILASKYVFVGTDTVDGMRNVVYDVYKHRGVTVCSKCNENDNMVISNYVTKYLLNSVEYFEKENRKSFNPWIGDFSLYDSIQRKLKNLAAKEIYKQNLELLKQFEW